MQNVYLTTDPRKKGLWSNAVSNLGTPDSSKSRYYTILSGQYYTPPHLW